MGKRIKVIVNESAEFFEREVNAFLKTLDSSDSTYCYEIAYSVRNWFIDGQGGAEFTACIIYHGGCDEPGPLGRLLNT